jgi:hypothetical protein
VVFGGFSQGATYSQVLSLITELDGIVNIDGGNDRCGNGNSPSSFYRDLGSIWSQTGGASPGNGEFAAMHEAHHGVLSWPAYPSVPDSFPYVQLHSTPHELDGPNEQPLPLSKNVVRTTQNWPEICVNVDENGVDLGFHGTMAQDSCMPTEATYWQTSHALVETSEYPPNLHLFPVYVEGFCNARALQP